MIANKIILIFLVCFTSLFAYQDYDIDGVEDRIDQCPNTPFDKLVDERGCSNDNKYYGKLTFQIGKELSFDKFSDTSSNLNLFVNYHYNKWDFSISKSIYSDYDNKGDMDITISYLSNQDKFSKRFALGKKIATSYIDISTGVDDYFGSINLNYFLNKQQNIFSYYRYTKSGDSDKINYKNSSNYSIGSGYYINNEWYSSISYEYSDSQYNNEEASRSISWFNSYNFTETFFTTVNYKYALDEFSSNHTILFNIGVYFE